jgi:uncharacterized protein YndB with AHSA1/START domain/DNA-binding transcriptional ArsR family regulator
MNMFSALGDPTRQSIIEMLARRGQLSATDISSKFRISPPAISQHLKVLREARLVDMEKRAQQRIYRINPEAMSEIEGWVQTMTKRWEARFAVLDEVLEVEKKKIMKGEDSTMNKTKITAEPGSHEIVITRDFDAPRELVFKAFTDPKLYTQWLGPRDLRMTLETFEPKIGGMYRYIHTDKDGNAYGFHGVFHEVTASERIIQTFEFEGLPEKGHAALDTARFEALPGGRTRLTRQSVFQSVAVRDGMIQSDMESGVNDSHERLDELLAKLKK